LNPRTIQKLRRKFILIATSTYFFVMVFIGGCINISNYGLTRTQIYKILDFLVEYNGTVPENTSKDYLNDFSPEFTHSARYFTVTYASNGDIDVTSTSHTTEVSDDEAEAYAQKAINRGRQYGRMGDYYYEVADTDDGQIVVFLNCLTQITQNRKIMHMTVLICMAGLVITVILVNIFSGRVVQPEIENMRRQKQFITNASHELKTPLAVIRANTEVEQMINGENEWSQSTMRQVDRLSSLVQNLIMISRAEDSEDRSLFTVVDISKTVGDMAESCRETAGRDQKTLIVHLQPGIHALADESRIRQLVSILTDNALKYCDDKGTISICLDTVRHGRLIRLVISNSFADGKDVDYSRFFDRFYREDESHAQDSEKSGYGIGLSIAESICRQYRGSIDVSWKDGVISFTCLLHLVKGPAV
jgi:two-component system sensor histidine kinase CiaH